MAIMTGIVMVMEGGATGSCIGTGTTIITYFKRSLFFTFTRFYPFFLSFFIYLYYTLFGENEWEARTSTIIIMSERMNGTNGGSLSLFFLSSNTVRCLLLPAATIPISSTRGVPRARENGKWKKTNRTLEIVSIGKKK